MRIFSKKISEKILSFIIYLKNNNKGATAAEYAIMA